MFRTAEEIAEKMCDDQFWDNDDAADLCELAGLKEEWDNETDYDNFIEMIKKAAGILGVVVY